MAPKTWLLARAVLELVLMVSFYVLAIGVAFVLLAVAYLQIVYLHVHLFTLIVFSVLAALAILWSLIPRRDRFVAPGPEVDAPSEPEFIAPGNLFLRVTHAVSRRQEFIAAVAGERRDHVADIGTAR
jgi:hypothetical protein